MEMKTQILGGFRFEPNRSFSATEDDNFKLWGSADGRRWRIVYCIVMTEWDVDHAFWNGSTWTYEAEQTEFEDEELPAQVKAAWEARDRSGK